MDFITLWVFEQLAFENYKANQPKAMEVRVNKKLQLSVFSITEIFSVAVCI
jgi:hypothetical protein